MKTIECFNQHYTTNNCKHISIKEFKIFGVTFYRLVWYCKKCNKLRKKIIRE